MTKSPKPKPKKPPPKKEEAPQPRDNGKHPGGRPPAYKAEYASQAEKLCQLGATDMEIGEFFDVDVRTIYRWKMDYPKFCQALKAGKDVADERVERSLYQRAIGYKHDAVKIFMPAGAVAPVYAPYVEHQPPDSTSAIFWLKNRRSGEWRDKSIIAHELPDTSGLSLEEIDALLGLMAKITPTKQT